MGYFDGEGFLLTNFASFSGVAPGGTFDTSVSFNSNMALGKYANTLFLNGASTNASGTSNLNAIQ